MESTARFTANSPCLLHHHHHHHHHRHHRHHYPHHHNHHHHHYHHHFCHHHHHCNFCYLHNHYLHHHHCNCHSLIYPTFSPHPLQYPPENDINLQANVYKETSASTTQVFQESEHNRLVEEEEEEEEEEDDPVFVLTDEWMEFFAKSEAKRKLEKEKKTGD